MLALLGLYTLNWLHVQIFLTYKIDISCFRCYESGVLLSFRRPSSMRVLTGGYINVNVPCLAISEWHPFSCFQHHTDPDTLCVTVAKNGGDWSGRLHELVKRPCRSTLWVQGPFVSPFNSSLNFDSLILVASGIGITPCLGVINSCGSSRAVHLIWTCRDASLIEFFLRDMVFTSGNSVIIYYTGSRPLAVGRHLPQDVVVFNHRANFGNIFRHIVLGSEFGTGLDTLKDQQERGASSMTAFRSSVFGGEAAVPALAFGEIAKAMMKLSRADLLALVAEHLGLRALSDGRMVAYKPQEFQLKDLLSLLGEVVESAENITQERLDTWEAAVSMASNGPVTAVWAYRFVEKTSQEILLAWSKDHLTARGNDTFDKHEVFQKEVLDKSLISRRWQACYCGGSKQVCNNAKAACDELGMMFRNEPLGW